MEHIELLAPAGDMECLETALYFGADAVYIGGPLLQLRANSTGFDMDSLQKAVDTVHREHKKIYVTVNSFADNAEIRELPAYARGLYDAGVDAVIVADIGVLAELHSAAPALPIHVSTQANCQNYAAAKTYHALGASRIVLGREMTLDGIRELREQTPVGLELEAFVHGAMCMAYSGRCMISAYMTGRSGNRGACAQPCRWKYALVEETRPGEYFPVSEADGAMTILSSRDLCAITFLDRLAAAGITSFKIEGRMKSPYYVGTVVNAYRRAIDTLCAGAVPDYAGLMQELHAVSHRDFSRGFYFGEIPLESAAGEGYAQDCVFIGVVKDCRDGIVTFQQRNRTYAGDILEVLSPHLAGASFRLERMTAEDGTPTDDAMHPAKLYQAPCSLPLKPGDILRRRITPIV